LQFVRPLRKLGHEVVVRVVRPEREWKSELPDRRLRRLHNRAATVGRLLTAGTALADAGRFDVICMNRDLLPEVRVSFVERLLARLNPRLIFDFDDAIFLGPRAEKLAQILPHFAAVTAGNEALARFARTMHSNVSVFPTVVDTNFYRPGLRRQEGPIRIGWTGSRQPLRAYLPMMEPVLTSLARQWDFEFVVICDEPPAFQWKGVKTRYVPWRAETEAADLQGFDIGIMPLPNGPFERYKCGAKAILYGACGLPAVVSPVGVNQEIVIDGQTGYHASTEQEWRSALGTLIAHGGLRRELGWAGRQHVRQKYSQQAVLPEMLRLFESVAAQGRKAHIRPIAAAASPGPRPHPRLSYPRGRA
jgi:glycosyltransferase involved in cell wall biosynthesis